MNTKVDTTVNIRHDITWEGGRDNNTCGPCKSEKKIESGDDLRYMHEVIWCDEGCLAMDHGEGYENA